MLEVTWIQHICTLQETPSCIHQTSSKLLLDTHHGGTQSLSESPCFVCVLGAVVQASKTHEHGMKSIA
jgi:hypothetical protein